jgi:hypothetical protein
MLNMSMGGVGTKRSSVENKRVAIYSRFIMCSTKKAVQSAGTYVGPPVPGATGTWGWGARGALQLPLKRTRAPSHSLPTLPAATHQSQLPPIATFCRTTYIASRLSAPRPQSPRRGTSPSSRRLLYPVSLQPPTSTPASASGVRRAPSAARLENGNAKIASQRSRTSQPPSTHQQHQDRPSAACVRRRLDPSWHRHRGGRRRATSNRSTSWASEGGKFAGKASRGRGGVPYLVACRACATHSPTSV